MPRGSPTLEGFRTAFRKPSLTFAEIAWRWTVGSIACGVFLFWLVEYLNTLLVTKADAALLSTKQPLLMIRAIAHILAGSMNRAVLSALVALIALTLLWIIAASFGRIATVRGLLERLRTDPSTTEDAAEPSRALRSVICLNFLRAAVTLAALFAFVGAEVLASFASSNKNPQPGLVFILFLPMAGFISFLWLMFNWLLSLAAIFAIRDGEDALGSLFAAAVFFRERSWPVTAVSTWIGLAHLVAFSIASTAASFPLALIQVVPWRLIAAIILLVTLAYFAVVDWLYIVRLAGYIFIGETPEALVEPAPLPPSSPQTFLPQSSMDRDELILSDLPNLAVET
jgi:hypothetical protein